MPEDRLDDEARHAAERDNRIANSFDLHSTLSHLLRRAHFSAEALFKLHLGHNNVTSRQLALLVAIVQNPGASQRELGDLIALDGNTVSDLIRRMIKKDLIRRHASKGDGRSFTLSLTNKSRSLMEVNITENLDYQNALAQHISVEEAEELRRILRKLLNLGK